jgi:hypothetical protein
MVLALISIILFGVSFAFGYSKPRSAIWFVAFTYPLLYPVNFPIVPSDIIYLNITRVSLAIILGVHFRRGKYFEISKLLKNSFVRAFLLFSIILVIVSIKDMPKYYLMSYIPLVYVSITLGYFLIQSENDYKKFINILTVHGLIFGVVIFLDFLGIANIQLFIAKIVPNFDSALNNMGNDTRAGIKRVSGLDGNAINSAVRLVILLPIAFLNNKFQKKIINYIFLFFIFCSMIILMSRAAYIGLLVALSFIIYQTAKLEKSFFIKVLALFKKFFLFSTILLALFTFVPFLNNVFQQIYIYSFEESTLENLDQRTHLFAFVYDFVTSNLLLGQLKSPLYVYNEILNGHDLASPLIYIISGGLVLIISFLNWAIRMPFYFLRRRSIKANTKELNSILILVSASFIGGLIPMLSNWIDTSISLMIIIFCATFKYNMIIERHKYPKLN